MPTPRKNPAQRHLQPPDLSASPTPTASTTSSRRSPDSVEKFNPFHDALGRFANKMGFKTYSANPKLKAAQPSIMRAHQAGHGRVLNAHRESKGESITQNANWLTTGQKPAVPAAVSRQRYQQRKLQQQQQAQQQQQSTQNQPQNQSASVSSGKATNAVNGKDLSGKFQFQSNSQDYAIEQVIKAQGFDGKPTLTSDKAAFAQACQASNFIAKRGVGASNQQTLNAYDQALKTGDFYVKCSGGSVHGYGMYAASLKANGSNAKSGISHAESTAQSYATWGKNASKIYTMTLDKSAKIGTESQLKRQMASDSAFKQACNSSSMNTRYTYDVGVYAAYKGYDAYIAGSRRNSADSSYSDYTVILNRSKVIIYDPSV